MCVCVLCLALTLVLTEISQADPSPKHHTDWLLLRFSYRTLRSKIQCIIHFRMEFYNFLILFDLFVIIR